MNKQLDKKMDKVTGTENYLWKIFEDAINERFLSGGEMPPVDQPFQKLADELNCFWRHAIMPRAQVIELLASNSFFQRYSYDVNVEDDYVLVTLMPDTEWFVVKIAVDTQGMSVVIHGDSHEAWRMSISFTRQGLREAQALIPEWCHATPVGFAGSSAIFVPDYPLLLNVLVFRGVDVCRHLDKAIIDTAKQYS